MRLGILLRTTGLALALLVAGSSASLGQPWVHYMPANHQEGQPTREVTNLANVPELCRGDGLPGLDLARGFAGRPTCPGRRAGIEFDVNPDHVLLINDTQRLSADLVRMLGQRGLLQTYRGRQVVRPSVVNFMREGRDTGMNLLVVGEMAFRGLGSNPNTWFGALTDRAGNTACELNERERTSIAQFSSQVVEMNDELKQAMLSALGNFETAMSFQSDDDAQPRIGAALVEYAIDEAKNYVVGKIAGEVPGFDIVVGLIESAVEENERAETAGRSRAMSEWIQRARTTITDCIGNAQCRQGSGESVQVTTSVSLQGDVEGAYCRLPENRRQAGLQAIESAVNNSLVAGRPSIRMFEKAIYEGWINGHFDSAADGREPNRPTQGTIEVVWQVEEENGALEFDGSTYVARVVIEEFGDNADDSLNRIIADVASVRQPWDFNVRKKACFMVDNVNPGGRSKVCWLLAEDNSVLRRGVGSLDMADRAFADSTWRRRTMRFRRDG